MKSVAVISALNPGRYLRVAVESLLDQTQPLDLIVVVDDGSTDGAFEEIADLFAKPNVERVTNPENRGRAASVNAEFLKREAEYFFLLDADDVALPTRVEDHIAFMDAHPKVGVSSGLIDYINAEGKSIGSGTLDIVNEADVKRYREGDEPCGLFCPAVVLRGTVVKDPKFHFRGEFWPADDMDLWNRILEGGWDVLAMPKKVTQYRIHGGSVVTSGFNKIRMKFEWLRACLRARRAGKDEPTEAEFLEEWDAAPWWVKFRRFRRGNAKRLYRASGFARAKGDYFECVTKLFAATALQPEWVLPRIFSQLKR